ncbi:imidazole glycerol phosphate synthase subunit HisH [Granulosicoccaceae sp. 1_MG-2023]|nr:imidazole glycerol phosphate synthase subunit HisH [Granulosicoccaceae sp. 1_MG-2023]
MQRIAIIDYGMGNLRSVSKALEHVVPDNTEVLVTSDREKIADSDRILCPGQGAARDCMRQLHETGMDQAVRDAVAGGRPFMGICMGLQVLLTRSEENDGTDCLGIVDGQVRRFADGLTDADSGARLKIPHMGWSRVEQESAHPMWQGIESGARFYFCHSYFVVPDDDGITTGRCVYGHPFTAVIARGNVFACQFHPEKSSRDGLQLLQNFSRWDGRQ